MDITFRQKLHRFLFRREYEALRTAIILSGKWMTKAPIKYERNVGENIFNAIIRKLGK